MRKPFSGRSFLKQLAIRKGLSNRKQLRKQLRGRKPLFESLEQRTVFATAVLPTVNLGQPITISEGFGYGSTIAGLGSAIDPTNNSTQLVGQITDSLGIEKTGTFTFETWLYPKPGQTNGVIWISGDDANTTREHYYLQLVNNRGLRFQIRGLAGSDAITADVTASDVLNRDAWNHIAVTFDGNRIQLFVNGINVASQLAPNQQLREIKRVDFQGRGSAIVSRSAGVMDEIQIWKIARSQEDIQSSMLTQLQGNEDGLAAYWNFDTPNPSNSNRELSATKNANSLDVTSSPRLLNAAPQIGYVDVLLSSEVTSDVGLWVTYNVSGDAKADVDYVSSRFRKVSTNPNTERNGIIIPKGENRGRIYFTAVHDAFYDPNESTVIVLTPNSFDGTSPSDYILGGNISARVNITDAGEFLPGAVILDSTGRPVTSSSPLYVDPKTGEASFQLKLTSSAYNPNVPSGFSFNPTTAYLTMTAGSASIKDFYTSKTLFLEITESDWFNPKRLTLTGVTGDGTITLNNTYGNFPYLVDRLTGQPISISFPFTRTAPADVRVEEGNANDSAAIVPTVNLFRITDLVENGDKPARVRVQLNTPAPKGGLDVFYSVTSSTTVREGVNFKKLPGLIHVDEGLQEAEIPIQSIDDINVIADRWIELALAPRATYNSGTSTKARVAYKEDDVARVVVSNPITVDITSSKSLVRPITTVVEGDSRYTFTENTLNAGSVGSFDSPAWTAIGGLGASFTNGVKDTDTIEFRLAQAGDSKTKISVKFTSSTANGRPAIALRKTGANEVDSVDTAFMFDIGSPSGTRLNNVATNTARYPTIVSDDTLEWSLDGLAAGVYRLVLATNPRLSGQLAAFPGIPEIAFDYEAKFTSAPKAPYEMFTTKTVTTYSTAYAPLVTAEPVPITPIGSEPNNDVATASVLGVVVPRHEVNSQTIASLTDIDVFKFTLDKSAGRPDTLAAVFARPASSSGGFPGFTRRTSRLLMDLLNSSGTLLVAGVQQNQNQYLDLQGLADGTYFVRIRSAAADPFATLPTEYSLKFLTIVNPSEPEGNEQLATATYMGVVGGGDRFNDFALTRQNDVDNYRFTLNTELGRPASVSVLSNWFNGNVSAILYSSAGNVLTSNALTQDTKTLSLASYPDGDYILQVKGEAPGILNSYDVAFGTITPRQKDINPNQFAVRLSAQPTANVTVALGTANPTQGRFSTSTLTFSPSNWNQFQNVVVTPLDDGVARGDVTYSVKATPTSPGDLSFANQLTNFDIINLDRGNFVQPKVEQTDDEKEGIVPIVSITTLSASSATEGQRIRFRLSVDRPISSSLRVKLDFSRSTAVEGVNFRVAGATTNSPLEFDILSNGSGLPTRDFEVDILDDQIQNSAFGSRLKIQATLLDGPGYRPVTPPPPPQPNDPPVTKPAPDYRATVEIVDINAAGFSIRNADRTNALATTLVTDETASTAAKQLTIQLLSKPKAETTVILKSSTDSEAVLSSDPSKVGTGTLKLVFTPTNWNVAQSFWVKGVDDLIADGNTSFKIGVSATGEDEVYRSLETVAIRGANTDNDTVGISVSSPRTAIDGRSNIFSVNLKSQPIGPVRVILTPRNDQVGINNARGGDPVTLTFDSLNWNIPQLVQAVAVDDKVVEFLHQSQIDFAIETGLHLDGLTSAANTTRETAIDLGILDGGLRWNNLEMRPTGAALPASPVQDQWIKFTLNRPTSLTNVIRLDALGDNWDAIPDVSLLDASGALLRTGVKTNVQYGPDNTLFKRAYTELGLQSLQPGTYFLSMKNSFPNRQFSLKLNAADAAFESLSLPSVPVSIKDNDLPFAEILAGPTASEVFSQPSYFAVRLNAPAPAGIGDTGVVVNFKVSGGRASQGSTSSIEHDYTVVADSFDTTTGIGWVRVAPGDTTANIGIVPVDDKLVEDVPVRISDYNPTTKSIILSAKVSDVTTSGTAASSYTFFDGAVIVARTASGKEVTFTVNKSQSILKDGSLYRGTVNVILAASDAGAMTAQGKTEMSGRLRSEDVQITLLSGPDYTLPLARDKQGAEVTNAINLDPLRVNANLTIFDDDVPGIRWIELQDHTTVAEGDVTTFQVALTSEPTAPVYVTLTPGAEFEVVDPQKVPLEAIGLYPPGKDPNTATVPVTSYKLVAADIANNLELTLVSVDETDKGFTASIDARLSRATLGATARKEVFEVFSNSTSLGKVTFDIPASDAVDFAGNPVDGRFDLVQRLTLSGLQRDGDNKFKLTGSFANVSKDFQLVPQPAVDRSVKNTTLTFNPSEWFKPQTVTIRGLTNSIAQPGGWRKDSIRYSTASTADLWKDLSINNQEIHILDSQFDVGATVDGLQQAFGAFEDSLDGLKIPMVGSVGQIPKVDGLFDMIETPLVKSVATQDTLSASSFEEVAESSISQGLFDVFEVTPSADADEVRVEMHLEKLINVGTVALDSSLGLDGLGIQFNTTGVATLDLKLSIDLAFGWHRQFGFYIDTAVTGLHVGAKLSLQGSGATDDNPENLFTGQGSFGFLQLKFNDDPSNPTELAITFDAKLRDLDNVNTIKFFDLNGDGILADTPILYDVGTDANKDGLIDLDADDNPIFTTTTLPAVEPFQTIGGKGSTELFPTVATISGGGNAVRGAAAANWNTTSGKATTFDESESIKNEGIYQVMTNGTKTLAFVDRNRNGKLDIGARKIDPFTTSWNSLTDAQKTSSEVWYTISNPQRVRELRVLTKGTGTTQEFFLDVNQNNAADATEKITPKLRKKLDKNSNGMIDADIKQDGEGAYQQGTSTAFFDQNGNARQDFSEPFISYSFEDFQVSTDLLAEDETQKLFFDFNGNGLFDTEDMRISEKADQYFLDFNGDGIQGSNELGSPTSDRFITLPSTVFDEPTKTAKFGSIVYPVITVDGERFIDFDENGELTVNEDGEPIEPNAAQRILLSEFDINRFVLRIHAADPNALLSIATEINLLKTNQDLSDVQKTNVRNAYNALVTSRRVFELPSDGDRLTLKELSVFRTSVRAANTTKSDQLKAAASELFVYTFQGYANLGLNTRTSIQESSILPAVQFDLAVNIPLFNLSNDQEGDENGFSVEFRNVAVDLGSFLRDYMVPILASANDALGPIKPIVKALNADTKLLGKLGLSGFFESDGKPGISLLEIAKKLNTGGSAQAAKIDKAIKFADQITTLVNTIDTLSQTLTTESSLLEFGTINLNDLRAGSNNPANAAKQARVLKRADAAPAPSTTLPATTASDIDVQAKKSSKFRDKYNALKNVDGLSINLFNPSTILSLMMGESNVDLIQYDIPDFNFAFDIAKEFKIWGPIAGKLEGGFSVSTDLSMGFDTNGLEQWAAQGFDPLKSYLALDGIYFDDWNPAGAEKDELTVRAYIAAGVGLDIGIASGFVKGGVEGIVGFDIVDVGERSGTSDGKIRGSDFIEKLSTSPGDLFDLTGTVNAFLGAEVTV
ncbi:MAG: LamG domain-containing protein, partial [Pirellula sp.]